MRKLSNTKKFIYLISPKSIVNSKEFFKDLEFAIKKASERRIIDVV